MKTDKTTTSGRLLATLRRFNPSKVRAFAADDDSRDIAVPTRRRKWEQVITAIEARAWVRVELLDKGGAVLGYVENSDEPAGEIEDLAPSRKALSDAGEVRLAERIVAMVTKAQREVMTFRDAEVQGLLRAQGDVVREMAAGVQALSQVYQQQVQATREQGEATAHAAAVAASANQGDLQQLVEAAPVLLQLLPLVKGLLNPGTTPPARPTNGVISKES